MKIGIRKETQYPSERRAPLTPVQVKLLTQENCEIFVEPAEQRIFTSEDYINSGAIISSDLSNCDIIFGVKEVPIKDLIPNKTFIFFSHTIKGQNYNMPLLKAVFEKNITLIDYELIKNEKGQRLIFFGNYAGYAGMINSLWLLGNRLLHEGIKSPLSKIKQALNYDNLASAEETIKSVGKEISENGLPKEITPLITGFSGYGNVSKGAQNIYDLLPVLKIKPSELEEFIKKGEFSNKVVYKVEFRENDMYKHVSNNEFNFDHFVKNPNEYESIFSKYIPNLSLLINGIYWENRFPKHVTKKFMKELYKIDKKHKLKVIGDISCDVEGSIEITVKNTDSNNPSFVYEPLTDEVKNGIEGDGPVVLAVDKLPAELPRESSQFFGNSLLPFIKLLASADYTKNFEEMEIPNEIKKAIIAHKGKLTPQFEYLKKYLS
ncbi:MAG: bifunctional lysine ketoglutarate reductase /saccharopine dehydrogenase family protein [Melioribacteraceae bacterium]